MLYYSPKAELKQAGCRGWNPVLNSVGDRSLLTVDGSVTETTFKPSDDTKQSQEAPGLGLSIKTASPTTLFFLAHVEMELEISPAD